MRRTPLLAVCLLAAAAAHAGEEGRRPLQSSSEVRPPAATPLIPADEDRSWVLGKSRTWLLEEVTRVEATRPSKGWVTGAGLLFAAGALSFLAGFFSYQIDQCGLISWGPCRGGGPRPGTLVLWGAGGGAMLTSLIVGGTLTHARASGDELIEELQRALEAQQPGADR